MRVVITGGAGFIGWKLALRLLDRGELPGPDGKLAPINELVLVDVVAPPADRMPEDRRLKVLTGDIADAALMRQAIAPGTGSVFHLAAVVSSHAEADTDAGLRVNLDGTRNVLDACRALGTAPRLVFSSSVAVYGGDEMPPVVSEATALTPQTSYGAQKACGELLVNDYSRKGYVDGRALRFPTVVVRPGRPNRAASSFASSIIREPLSGQEAVCPVSRDPVMAIVSPRRLIEAVERAHDAPAEAYGGNRILQLPAISPSVGEMVEALRRAGGEAAVARIRWEPDPAIARIVAGWAPVVDGSRAERMGIRADRDMDEIVTAFIEDDLPAQLELVGGRA
jgi:nucleoside-diphosphate-sugar epimerase